MKWVAGLVFLAGNVLHCCLRGPLQQQDYLDRADAISRRRGDPLSGYWLSSNFSPADWRMYEPADRRLHAQKCVQLFYIPAAVFIAFLAIANTNQYVVQNLNMLPGLSSCLSEPAVDCSSHYAACALSLFNASVDGLCSVLDSATNATAS